MTDKRIIENVLLKQRKDIDKLRLSDFKKRYAARHLSVNDNLLFLTGIRSVGKTTLALHVLDEARCTYAYVDLSDSTFHNINPDLIEALYEVLYKVYDGFEHIVIDDFAVSKNWVSCIDFFVKRGIKVIAICSGEVPQEALVTPHNKYTLYPLSFSEYCLWHGIDVDLDSPQGLSKLRTAFDDFMARGGLPGNQSKTRLKGISAKIITNILAHDIRGDFRKGYKATIDDMGRHIVESSPFRAFYNLLADRFCISSENTAKKYTTIIKNSGLIYSLLRFARHEKLRNYCEKLYAADHSFLTFDNIEGRLETVVYLQLLRFCERHKYMMHYYGNRELECDFALCSNKKMRTIIQVMYDYSDTVAIKEKVAGLIALSQTTRCDRLFILTDNCHDTIEARGLTIVVKPVYEFLLDRSHMIVSAD